MYTTGSGLGSFGGPVVMQLLLDTYGLSGAVLIISALTSHYFLCAALFIPVQKNTDDFKIADFSVIIILRVVVKAFKSVLPLVASPRIR